MKKNSYKKELSISNTQQRLTRNTRKDVMKIQSWLTLYSIENPVSAAAVVIDGIFGAATERAVKNFQKLKGLQPTGIVDQSLFLELTTPLQKAFNTPLKSTNFRDLVVEVAHLHLQQHPQELIIKGESNSGPWVRSYMDGHDGTSWYWCMGFVQTVLDQAATQQNKNFTKLMPLTYSCDTVGKTGLHKGLLHRYQQLRKDSSLIKPGDVFLSQKSKYDWVHTGIITAIEGDVIETIEGNTNQKGSRNGIAVMKKIRNFHRSKIDVFSIKPIV